MNVHAPQAHLEVTPRILRKRYNTTGIESKSANNSQAVAQFLGQVRTQSVGWCCWSAS